MDSRITSGSDVLGEVQINRGIFQVDSLSKSYSSGLGGEELKRVHEVKYLGVSVDESLSWTTQYKKLKSKLKNELSSIRKLKNILPQTKLDQVYRALLESHLRYCNEIWGSFSNTKLDHLQRLQNRARTPIGSSRLEYGWRCTRLSVSSLIEYDRAIMIYKITNDLCPDSLKGRFSTRSQLSNYRLMNSLDIKVPRQKFGIFDEVSIILQPKFGMKFHRT